MATDLKKIARESARDELFAYRLYNSIAERFPEGRNRRTMAELADQERGHVRFWLSVLGEPESSLRPPRLKHFFLVLAARVLGPAFTIRWLERGEDKAIGVYRELLDDGQLSPDQQQEVLKMLHEEEEHEQILEQGVADERRAYLGAAVLGLNDALVELTGGLTGLVSSISRPKLIGFAGLVVGVAASMSMAASNFLSVDIGEESELKPVKAATYTGTAYILVVLAMVAPFFILSERHIALAISWGVAILVIAAFSYYSSVMQGASFKRRFTVMLALGLGVAVISFFFGRFLGSALGIRL